MKKFRPISPMNIDAKISVENICKINSTEHQKLIYHNQAGFSKMV